MSVSRRSRPRFGCSRTRTERASSTGTGRTVSLTPLGHRLVEITTRLFGAEEEANALLSGARTLVTGHLRIAADSAAHAMPLLAELKRRHGGLTFSLSMGNSSEVVSQVLDYAADIGVTAEADLVSCASTASTCATTGSWCSCRWRIHGRAAARVRTVPPRRAGSRDA